MSYIVSGSDAPEPLLSGILHALHSMQQEQQVFQRAISARLCAIELRVSSRNHDDFGPGIVGDAPAITESRSRSNSRRRPDPGLPWICPICDSDLKHRESFKGHIRLRVLLQHQSCRFMADNIKHQALLSKFNNGDFDSSAAAFTLEFYKQIRICTSSLDADIKSHGHIFGWLEAAVADQNVPFPVYAAARGDSKRCRKASESAIASDAAFANSSMSSNSSPELVGVPQLQRSTQ